MEDLSNSEWRRRERERRQSLTPGQKLIEKLEIKRAIACHKAQSLRNRAEGLRARADRFESRSAQFESAGIRYDDTLQMLKRGEDYEQNNVALILRVK